jgi:LPS-assembly protein
MHVQKTYALPALILAAGLLSGAPLFGAEAPKPQEQIHMTADSLTMSEKGTEIEGQGNVEFKRQEMILKADRVWANRETNDMQAIGNVSVADPEWKLKFADRVRFNLTEETGTIENGDLFLEKGHVSLSGRRLEKYAGQSYHIDDGIFTTCLCEDGPPTWKISAAEIDVTREGSGRIRSGVFYIMDVPVFYLPYAIFPVKSERQTGLLFPEFGTSTKTGFRYMQPFYWAISKSSDATLSFETETKARIGFLTEYRQMFSRNAEAQINLTYFNESLRNNPEGAIKNQTIADCDPKSGGGADCGGVIPQNRWSVVANHRQTGAAGWTTYSDVALVSDDFYVRELARTLSPTFDRERDIKTSRYSLSRAGFLRHWGDATLRGEWDYYQDFIQADGRTLQRTPQVAFTGRSVLGNTPLELRWRTTGVNYLSQEGADGLRVDLRPELVLPFHLANYLHGSFGVAPRETAYHLYDPTETPLLASCSRNSIPIPPFSEIRCSKVRRTYARNSSRELVEVNGALGTSFGRVFSWEGEEIERIKHIIEPEVKYLYVSQAGQSDIPIMDGVDRVNRRNLTTFSLTNRFWGRFAQIAAPLEGDAAVEPVQSLATADTRELARLRFAVSYDMSEERKTGNRFSDVDIDLRLRPKDYLAVGAGTGVNPNSGQVSQATALFSIADPRPITRRVLDRDFMRPNSLDLSYRFIGKTIDAPLIENANLFLIDPNSPKFCPPGAPRKERALDPRCGIKKDVMGLIGMHGLFHITDHLLFLYDANYNANRGGFTTNRGSLKLLSRCECWTLTFSLNRTTNPDDTNFAFSFALLGLGSQAKEAFR